MNAAKLPKIQTELAPLYEKYSGIPTFDFIFGLLKSATTQKEARDILKNVHGGLSKTSKMPTMSINSSAFLCNTGSKLNKIEGTVCENCYALKGFYAFPKVKQSLIEKTLNYRKPEWVGAVVISILLDNKGKWDKNYFRFHDSGDVQDVEHLDKIVQIANHLPNLTFWLPTKEKKFLHDYLKSGRTIPVNLVVRVSGFYVDEDKDVVGRYSNYSVVLDEKSVEEMSGEYSVCPSSKQGNQCLDCRACWDKNIQVAYLKH